VPAGVVGAIAVGVASAHGDAAARATGVAGQASLGRVAVHVEAMVPADGVQACAAVGPARAAGDATATPQGAQGLGAVGSATIDIVRMAASDWIRCVIPAERRSFTLAPEARTWILRKP